MGICRSIRKTLERSDYKVSCFNNGHDCLKELSKKNGDLLITDVNMPGMDGFDLLKNAKHIAPWMPVIVITSHGNIPMAVRAIRAGAIDFIEKPLHRDAFLKRVRVVIDQNDNGGFLHTHELTEKELKILKLILEGKSNKKIAYLIERSTRTVEFHRSRIMKKFGADNIIELVKRASILNIDQL